MRQTGQQSVLPKVHSLTSGTINNQIYLLIRFLPSLKITKILNSFRSVVLCFQTPVSSSTPRGNCKHFLVKHHRTSMLPVVSTVLYSTVMYIICFLRDFLIIKYLRLCLHGRTSWRWCLLPAHQSRKFGTNLNLQTCILSYAVIFKRRKILRIVRKF